ncbi:MAG TPA: hypothetical protein VE546_25970 [Streptomyces sp.]|uniref:hypothetical protein n=1 Tax=Streptomyces sp. TaxID=1931 RepID=UPI002D2CA290|nr:hypothetical protein [Streptomyces sp.]HZG06971.1 hypothetical protein [Streptomyces sp.]
MVGPVSNGRTETYTVYVDFLDEDGPVVDTGSERVRLRAGGTERVEVEPGAPGVASRVEDCRLDRVV